MSRSNRKEQVIEATVALLRQAGLGAATINRALAESGAPKGSLYYYFPGGKTELVTTALARFAEEFRVYLAGKWRGAEPFAQRWAALCEGMARGLAKSKFTLGCPVAATVLDLEPGDEAIRAAANDILAVWIDELAAGLPDLPAPKRKPFATTLFALLEGALILARAQTNTTSLLAARDFGIAAHQREAGG